jgi:hypothetical protein
LAMLLFIGVGLLAISMMALGVGAEIMGIFK